eukprot:COSAG04_NODE_209_length_20232_cov_116.817315_19_plen_74_part_00
MIQRLLARSAPAHGAVRSELASAAVKAHRYTVLGRSSWWSLWSAARGTLAVGFAVCCFAEKHETAGAEACLAG